MIRIKDFRGTILIKIFTNGREWTIAVAFELANGKRKDWILEGIKSFESQSTIGLHGPRCKKCDIIVIHLYLSTEQMCWSLKLDSSFVTGNTRGTEIVWYWQRSQVCAERNRQYWIGPKLQPVCFWVWRTDAENEIYVRVLGERISIKS